MQPREVTECRGQRAYRAFVGFFAGVPSHVHDEHVLGLEWLFLPRALLPAADEALLVGVNVIIVDVLHEIVLQGESDS